MVMDKVRQANRSPRMRALMEAHEKIRRDNENFLDDAIIEAEARGDARGEARGKERRNRGNARTMKAERIDTAAIIRVTGLTAEEIEAL